MQAVAQGQPPETPADSFVIVGTHLPAVDPEGMAPVLVVDRLAIARSGLSTVVDLLQQLPMDNAGTINDRDALSSAIGGAAISFRGIGANSVLVLINGRRAATYGFPHVGGFGSLVSFVDLNSIPIAAVERIEVMKDGASAIYGSDAVAGVVNIALREGFSGTELEVRAGAADSSGAEERGFNALLGWQMPRTSVELVATHTKREQLYWRDRVVSASANHDNRGGIDQRSLAALNFYVGGSLVFGPDCEKRRTVDGLAAYAAAPDFPVCVFDQNTEIVVPSAARTGLMALVTSEVGSNITLHIEASYLAAEAEARKDSTPWSTGTFPAVNPWNPFGRDVLADYRFTEAGPRVDVIETDNVRAVFSLEGELGSWRWEAGALVHDATTQDRGEGYLSANRIEQALRGVDLDGNGALERDEFLNLYSPASHPTSPALIQSLTAATLRRSQTSLQSYDLRFSRPWLRTHAGNASVALGIEHRSESLEDASDPLSVESLLAAANVSRNWFGLRVDRPFSEIDPVAYVDPWDVPDGPLEPFGFPDTHGDRSVNSVFSELHVPLLERVDLQTALRLEDFGDSAAELGSRVALRFDASSRLTFRGSWATGFRAPSLAELYVGPAAKLQASWDPKRCPEEGFLIPTLAGGCVVRSFVTVSQGNEDLEPERAESLSVGFSADVFDRHTLSLDCWREDVADKILAPATALIIRREDDLPGLVVRDPPERAWFEREPAGPTPIAQINIVPLNFGRQRVAGCDFDLASSWETAGGSTFETQLLATHMASNELAYAPGDPLEQLAGSFGYPANRANLNLSWAGTDWQAGLYARWIDGFADTLPGANVASHVEWDTQLSYAGFRGLKLTLGAENLLDTSPPTAVGVSNSQGFPVQFYDMRGRFVYVQAKLSFGVR